MKAKRDPGVPVETCRVVKVASFPENENVRSGRCAGCVAVESSAGEELPDGHDWYGQVLQWRTWLWLHQAGRWRARCVRSHHRGRTSGVEGFDRRTTRHFRG